MRLSRFVFKIIFFLQDLVKILHNVMKWEIMYESYVFKGNNVFTLVSSVGEEIADLPNSRNR